tara:strand:+ start:224 stop:415 length:192 start_codon:yes stop_codon:yes gene_type:complete
MDNEQKTFVDWKEEFDSGSSKQSAELAAKFMFAMSYYYDRMRLHMMLHPLFYLAGFITAYALL